MYCQIQLAWSLYLYGQLLYVYISIMVDMFLIFVLDLIHVKCFFFLELTVFLEHIYIRTIIYFYIITFQPKGLLHDQLVEWLYSYIYICSECMEWWDKKGGWVIHVTIGPKGILLVSSATVMLFSWTEKVSDFLWTSYITPIGWLILTNFSII